MKKEKNFDCLKMKDEIQTKLREEWKDLSWQEIQSRFEQRMKNSDDPLANLWRQVREREEAESEARARETKSILAKLK